MTRVCVHIVRHALVLISLLADAGLSFAAAQMKLDATYKATLLGLPIGSAVPYSAADRCSPPNVAVILAMPSSS